MHTALFFYGICWDVVYVYRIFVDFSFYFVEELTFQIGLILTVELNIIIFPRKSMFSSFYRAFCHFGDKVTNKI